MLRRMASSLDRCALSTTLVVLDAASTPEVTRRLSELGLRPGAHIRLVQRTAGGGRVLDIAGSRVALGRDLLRVVSAEPAPHAQPGIAGAAR